MGGGGTQMIPHETDWTLVHLPFESLNCCDLKRWGKGGKGGPTCGEGRFETTCNPPKKNNRCIYHPHKKNNRCIYIIDRDIRK